MPGKNTLSVKQSQSTAKAPNAAIVPQDSAQENTVLLNPDSEQRYGMIAEAAYLIAEQRNFQGEAELDDWLQAEADVDARLLAQTQLSH